MIRRVSVLGGAVLLAAGAALLTGQAVLRAKAILAERWIARAWERHLADGAPHLPWAWADTRPIARLEVERLGVTRHILEGASGSSLAFGPGHVHGTAPPNRRGNCVIAGHRDTWFAFLRELRVGDSLRLQTRDAERRYVVADVAVIHEEETEILAPSADRRLTLITCYPFDGASGSPWRYAVRLRSADG